MSTTPAMELIHQWTATGETAIAERQQQEETEAEARAVRLQEERLQRLQPAVALLRENLPDEVVVLFEPAPLSADDEYLFFQAEGYAPIRFTVRDKFAVPEVTPGNYGYFYGWRYATKFGEMEFHIALATAKRRGEEYNEVNKPAKGQVPFESQPLTLEERALDLFCELIDRRIERYMEERNV